MAPPVYAIDKLPPAVVAITAAVVCALILVLTGCISEKDAIHNIISKTANAKL